MKTLMTLACLAALTSTALAETFSLKDTATDKTYGPFHYNYYATLHIGDTKWKMVRHDPRHNEILATTQQLTLLPLDFKDACLADIALFLTETCRRQGAEDLGIMVGHKANESTQDAITLSMGSMTLYDALCRIAETSGNQWTIRHGVIVFEASKQTGHPVKLPPSLGNDGGQFNLQAGGTGKLYGPFQLKNKTFIQLDEAILEMILDPDDAAIVSNLKAMKISTLDFRDATPQDVLLFLNETIKRLPENPAPEMRVVLGTEIANNEHHVTCSIRNQSLYNALGMICESSGMEWSIAGGKVVIELPQP